MQSTKIELTEAQRRVLANVIGSEIVRLGDNIRADAGTIFVKDYKVDQKKLQRILDKLRR